MRTKYCVLFLLLGVLCPVAILCPVAYGKSHSSSSKPVRVDDYYRKDGTYVAPHDRSLPGYADHTKTHTEPTSTYRPALE